MARILIIVLTAGNIRVDGQLQPSLTSRIRLSTSVLFAMFLPKDKIDIDLLILGGRRDDPAENEAEILLKWAKKERYLDRFDGIFTLAEGKYTVADIAAVPGFILEQERFRDLYYAIILVCHFDQARLAIRALKSLGFRREVRVVETVEKRPYPWWCYWYLKLLSVIDPLWRGPFARPLVWLANRRS